MTTETPISMFETGPSSVIASRMDPRFSYCFYVPERFDRANAAAMDLVVIVHGSERGMQTYRDDFAAFAEEHGVVVFCPLFPQNALHQGDLHSYKTLRGHGVDYDLILLDMIEELAGFYPVRTDRFLLYGFSGGGQFSHRFLMAHPERLMGVAIGAPGTVTLLDETRDYWVGTRDFDRLFGHAPDIAAMARVPVHLLIGDNDVNTRWCEITPGDPFFWMEDANHTGNDRVSRITALLDNFVAHGIAARMTGFAGVGHDDITMLDTVKAFFSECLKNDQRQT